MHAHTVAVDFDGTLVTNAWPDIGEWQPGAVEAMNRLHEKGIHLVVHTARIAPVDPWGERRLPSEVFAEIQDVRLKLDQAGLTFMPIHTDPWKPGATVYVDDKAERYTGRPGSWDKMVTKLLARCGVPNAPFPPLLADS